MSTIKKFDSKTGMMVTFDQFHALRGDDGVGGYKNTDEWDHLPEIVNAYDSEADTRKHIARVNELLLKASQELIRRGIAHDASKLGEYEKPYFDREGNTFARIEFGTPEYTAAINRLGPALQNHYAENSHHPQHYENGILGMDLFDLVEMLCDWKAAGERDSGGNIVRSIQVNAKRFNIPEALVEILTNHAARHFPTPSHQKAPEQDVPKITVEMFDEQNIVLNIRHKPINAV